MKQILAPVCMDSGWSLYVWNFERKTVIVIDPVTMVEGSDAVMVKHKDVVHKLHQVMCACKVHFFKTPEASMLAWGTSYLSVQGSYVDR